MIRNFNIKISNFSWKKILILVELIIRIVIFINKWQIYKFNKINAGGIYEKK